MKTVVDKIIFAVVLFLLTACGSSSVKMNKYMLDEFTLSNDSSISFEGKTILIANITQSPIMRTGNIPYKLNNVKVNYFVGDKWITRVDELFKRNLFEAIKETEMFGDVYSQPGLATPHYYLYVYIDYLGEELIDEKRYATIKVDLRFIDNNSRTLLYDKIEKKSLITDDIEDENYVTKLVEKLSKNISLSLANSFVKFYNIQK